jgi:hypothetical protein
MARRRTRIETPSRELPSALRIPRTAIIPQTIGFSSSIPTLQTIFQPPVGDRVFVVFISFTVTDECTVQFLSGSRPLTGKFHLGGIDEPRAMVLEHSRIPMTLDVSQGLRINAEGKGQIDGYCILYTLTDPWWQ